MAEERDGPAQLLLLAQGSDGWVGYLGESGGCGGVDWGVGGVDDRQRVDVQTTLRAQSPAGYLD